ncbi:hypothetical protein GOV07_02765 [Candidatus Woesearchaeota archaeon]|nr:hypothetical protein [Candidatus Woesearchaeota archaeon]
MTRAQMSLEYLLLIGFAIAVLLPGIYLLYTHNQSSSSDISGAQYALLGEELISAAKKTVAQGDGSYITVNARLPDNLLNINISNGGKELVMIYQTPYGPSRSVFFSDSVILANGTGEDGTIFVIEPHGGKTAVRLSSNRTGVVWVKEWIA